MSLSERESGNLELIMYVSDVVRVDPEAISSHTLGLLVILKNLQAVPGQNVLFLPYHVTSPAPPPTHTHTPESLE